MLKNGSGTARAHGSALAHGSGTARAARLRDTNLSRNNSGSVVVTNPRLPHVGVRGLLALGNFFCRATVISLFPAYQEGVVMFKIISKKHNEVNGHLRLV